MTQKNTNETINTLMDEGRKVVNKANQRHIVVRKQDGSKLLELSATMFALAVVLIFLFQPIGSIVAVAAIGYAIYAKVKIEVTHELSGEEPTIEVNPTDD